MKPRRLALQLTPLLDLLLIVIFAQYLDVRTTAERAMLRAGQERAELTDQLDLAVRQLTALRAQLLSTESALRSAEVRASIGDQWRAERDFVGELLSELFRIPEGELQRILAQRQAIGPGPSPADLTAIKARWKQLAPADAEQLVAHLQTFGEMRKRMDLWEVHLLDDGTTRLTVGPQVSTFRAETPEAFATQLFEQYKTLPEPKSLVLVLVSYGDAQFRQRKAAIDGLPMALEKVRGDSGGRSRFDYAILGFRPNRAGQ